MVKVLLKINSSPCEVKFSLPWKIFEQSNANISWLHFFLDARFLNNNTSLPIIGLYIAIALIFAKYIFVYSRLNVIIVCATILVTAVTEDMQSKNSNVSETNKQQVLQRGKRLWEVLWFTAVILNRKWHSFLLW